MSIGTIYRYFPQGKVSIIKTYFDTVQKDIFNIEDITQSNIQNIQDFLKRFTSQFVRIHRENLLYFRAYEQAMLENQEVFEGYKQKVLAFIDDVALKLHQSDPISSQIPVEILKARLLVIYNVFNALTRQHLVIMPLFPTDEEFIDFLTKLLIFFLRETIERYAILKK
jgi:hypothetical protein